MAFKYKLIERNINIKGAKEVRQVAVQVNSGTVTTRGIAQDLQDLTSLGRGDVRNVLEHLGEVVAKYLLMGRSVRLEGLGTFSPRIKAYARPVGEEYTSAFIKGVNMRFTPDKYVKAQLAETGFECQKECQNTDTCPAKKAPKGEESTPSTPPNTPPNTGGEGTGGSDDGFL